MAAVVETCLGLHCSLDCMMLSMLSCHILAAGNRVTICARNWISFYISATSGNFLRLEWNRHGVDAAAGADGELRPLPEAVLPRLPERHRAARSRPSMAKLATGS